MLASNLKCLRTSVKQYLTRSFATESFQTIPRKGDRVVVGMSGGVDSSVAAKLLSDQDFDLSAVYMRNWDTRDESGTDEGCEWKKDWEDVQRVCKVLDIPCSMIDLSKQYWNQVFEPSLRVWEKGLTPNPDVWCNREIKFGALLEHLPKTQWFATGHYASKSWSQPTNCNHPPRPKLLRPSGDRTKDQTYYLSSISEPGLFRALFPLSDLPKPQVREMARKWELPTAERKESMGLCFVGERPGRFGRFLSGYLPPNPGPIRDLSADARGKVIGEHEGLWTYTIGQGAKVPGMPNKMFVARKDLESNTVWVVPGSNNDLLKVDTFQVHSFQWIWTDSPPPQIYKPEGFQGMVRVRHRMEPVGCTVIASSPSLVRIEMDEAQHGVAPGQVAAIWDGDWCLGCGIIG